MVADSYGRAFSPVRLFDPHLSRRRRPCDCNFDRGLGLAVRHHTHRPGIPSPQISSVRSVSLALGVPGLASVVVTIDAPQKQVISSEATLDPAAVYHGRVPELQVSDMDIVS